MTKSILSRRIKSTPGVRAHAPDVQLATSDCPKSEPLAGSVKGRASLKHVSKNHSRTRRPGVRFFSRFTSVALLAVLGFFFSITSPSVPDAQNEATQYINATFASLTFSGTDEVVTGSVNDLFASSAFVGPNRAEKRDRLLPEVDVLELAGSFVAERTRIAALRSAPPDPLAPPQSSPVLGSVTTPDQTGSNISVANINPGQTSAALLAIQGATPVDLSIPVPLNESEQLAYARQSTPTTEHAVSRYSERERWCLSTGIYFEARGESYRGQVGVAQVIMNRVEHRLYPNTICGVVFQNQSWRNRCQFSFACDGKPERVNDRTAWAKAEEITEKVLEGTLYLSEVSNATHYHANYVYPHWASRMKRLTRIGAHIFYRFRSG